MLTEQCKITVKGRVQGVFFRASTLKKARHYSINGTVKNTPDGHVEIIAVGEQEAMHEFIQWCHTGSFPAKVTAVLVVEITDAVDYNDFTIIKQ